MCILELMCTSIRHVPWLSAVCLVRARNFVMISLFRKLLRASVHAVLIIVKPLISSQAKEVVAYCQAISTATSIRLSVYHYNCTLRNTCFSMFSRHTVDFCQFDICLPDPTFSFIWFEKAMKGGILSMSINFNVGYLNYSLRVWDEERINMS